MAVGNNPTSYTDFVTALSALTVSGVVRQYTEPPRAVSSADLPVSYTRLPSGEEPPLTTGDRAGGWPTLTAELVVLVQAIEQNNQQPNYTDTLNMMDNVSAALRGVTTKVLAMSKPSWQIRIDIVSLNEQTAYWAVIATVTARG